MKPNRSIPSSTVIPVLIYPDVREAVAWLTAAFGFAERVQIGEDHRSQLRVGDGAVIVGDVRHDRRPPRPGEVDALGAGAGGRCERPLRARPRRTARRILMEPTDFEYGERQYAAQDPRATSGRSPRRSRTSPPKAGAGSRAAPEAHAASEP